MGTSKPLLAPEGRSFLERTVGTLMDGGCGQVLVGVRPGDDAVAREATRVGAHVLFPERVEDGPIATIRATLGRLGSTPPDPTIVVLPVDHPAVAPDTVRRLVAALAEAPPAVEIAVPRVGPHRGHPALFRGAALRELVRPELEGGARTVVRRDPGRVLEVEVSDPGVLANVDTPEALARVFAPGTASPGPETPGAPHSPDTPDA